MLGQLNLRSILGGCHRLVRVIDRLGQVDVHGKLGQRSGLGDATATTRTLSRAFLRLLSAGLRRRRLGSLGRCDLLSVRGLGFLDLRHSGARAALLGGSGLLDCALIFLTGRGSGDRAQGLLGALMIGIILNAARLSLLLLLPRTLRSLRRLLGPGGLHRVVVNDEAAALAGLTRGGERLDEALTHALTGHLHEAQGCNLGDLVTGTISSQALDEATQHEITVGFEDHIDEVDDDDATDVTQAQLADDLFGGLEVVTGHRLLERTAGTDELAGVDVDDGHRLGAVDDEGAARGEPHLAVHALGELLVDAVRVEDVLRAHPLLDAIGELGAELVDVFLDGHVGVAPLDNELREVLIEDVAHDAHGKLGLAAQQRRGALRVGALLLDVFPLAGQASDVVSDLLLRRAFRGGAHDDARTRRNDSLEDLLQASALLVR